MRFFLAVCLLSLLQLSITPDAAGPKLPSTTPNSSLVFKGAIEAARDLPRLHSLLVSRSGSLVLEQYFNGASAKRPANVKSVSKSVISALVGIAVGRGLIPGVDTSIDQYFADILRTQPVAKRAITIEDLLTMRSGLETTSNRNYGAWVLSLNWVRYVLTRPLLNKPGTVMDYSTGNAHLLSAILTKTTGMSTWQFAQNALAKPLGFSLPQWPRDPQGIYFGGNDMLMTPRQMLAFGEMYLRDGRANGIQIVPAGWIETSFVPRGSSMRGVQDGRQYGYGWWMRPYAGHQTYYAWGYGGQYVYVVPDLELVVVATSSPVPDDPRRIHRRTLDSLVEDLIIALVAGAP